MYGRVSAVDFAAVWAIDCHYLAMDQGGGVNVLSLFAGIGGLDLGLEWAGFRTINFVERDPACQHWLAQHWPAVPIHGDIHTFSGVPLRGLVDLVCGGFPCQPFSVAGKQKGTEDERHLWPEMSRIIREVRPRWVLAENVPGLRTIAADLVLEDLEGQGYTPAGRSWWVLMTSEGRTEESGSGLWPTATAGDAKASGAAGYSTESGRHSGTTLYGRSGAGTLADDARDAGGQPSDGGADRERTRPGGDEAVADASCGGLGTDGQPLGHAGHPDISESPVGEPTGQGLEGQRPDPRKPEESEPRNAVRWPSRPGEPQHPWEAPRLAVVNAHRKGSRVSGEADTRQGQRGEGEPDHRPTGLAGATGGMADSPSEPPRSPGQSRKDPDPREPEFRMGDAVDGFSRRLAGFSSAHRREALKALGNAVSPPCAYYIGRSIMNVEQERVA